MPTEAVQTVNLAIGRLFRLASRPTKAGDVADYERCRSVIIELCDPSPSWDRVPNYAHDRLCGAQGD